MITPTQVSESTQRNSQTLLYKGNNMDPILHTVLAAGLMFITYQVGKLLGKRDGINATVAFLLHMGVCTERDLQKANQQFEDNNF